MKNNTSYSYWKVVWNQFRQHKLGSFALFVVFIFCLAGIYAPFLASSKPIAVQYDGEWYFPLFRYLFYRGFFTKRLDLFYNLLIFTLPLFILNLYSNPPWRKYIYLILLGLQFGLFAYFAFRTRQNPESDPTLSRAKQKELQQALKLQKQNPLSAPPLLPNWENDLKYMTPYAKLNLLLSYKQKKNQKERLEPYLKNLKERFIPLRWYWDKEHEKEEITNLNRIIEANKDKYPQAKLQKNLEAKRTVDAYEKAQAQIEYIEQRNQWLEKESLRLKYQIMPLLRPYHWEDDVGGSQELNQQVRWWELTRINRKDMVAALIFGIRISLSVGLMAVGLALLIGIPIGSLSGYYGGKIDIATYRLIEIWESMPTFFMLLMVVAFLQSKSIFIVITVIGLFGWTSFSRYVRGEFFKQKQLPYVEACRAQGFSDGYIMFSHLLPNAIPPLLTLVPFAIMGAITSEAGLSFLGLGEEGSGSWGVLMDEGRTAFPAESYLLWPPAILLTILLVSIALVGDALRDSLDPKLHRYK